MLLYVLAKSDTYMGGSFHFTCSSGEEPIEMGPFRRNLGGDWTNLLFIIFKAGQLVQSKASWWYEDSRLDACHCPVASHDIVFGGTFTKASVRKRTKVEKSLGAVHSSSFTEESSSSSDTNASIATSMLPPSLFTNLQ